MSLDTAQILESELSYEIKKSGARRFYGRPSELAFPAWASSWSQLLITIENSMAYQMMENDPYLFFKWGEPTKCWTGVLITGFLHEHERDESGDEVQDLPSMLQFRFALPPLLYDEQQILAVAKKARAQLEQKGLPLSPWMCLRPQFTRDQDFFQIHFVLELTLNETPFPFWS